MASPMVAIMHYDDIDQAQFYRERLENAGYNPVVVDNTLENDPAEAENPLPEMGGRVELQVPENQVQAATQVLQEEFDSDLGGNPSVQ